MSSTFIMINTCFLIMRYEKLKTLNLHLLLHQQNLRHHISTV